MIRGAALSPCTKHKTTSAIQSCTLHMPPQKHKTPNAKHKKTQIDQEKQKQNSNIRNKGLRFGLGINRLLPAKMQMKNVQTKATKLCLLSSNFGRYRHYGLYSLVILENVTKNASKQRLELCRWQLL